MHRDIVQLTHSPSETKSLARGLGEKCRGGEVLLMVGPLGAGKTCFVQGLAAGLDVQDNVHSPTFVLMGQYRGRLTLYHMDFYRIEDHRELREIGLEECFRTDTVVVVEWADKFLEVLPEEYLLVDMIDKGGDKRSVTLRAKGMAHEAFLNSYLKTA